MSSTDAWGEILERVREGGSSIPIPSAPGSARVTKVLLLEALAWPKRSRSWLLPTSTALSEALSLATSSGRT